MNKEEFLQELEERLIGISKEDKKEILQDYKEHFKVGKKKKRTEKEISNSLGDPKEIAKEIRKELSDKKDKEWLENDAIETWVALKKFSINAFNATKKKSEELYEKFDSGNIFHWILLFLGTIIIFTIIGAIGPWILMILIIFGIIILINKSDEKSQRNKSHKKKKKKKNKLNNVIVSLISIFILIIFWVPLFFIIIGFLISGVCMIVGGIFLIIYSVFYFINYDIVVLKNLFFSALFAGVGLSLLGILFVILFDKIQQLFFKFTKKSFQLKKRLKK